MMSEIYFPPSAIDRLAAALDTDDDGLIELEEQSINNDVEWLFNTDARDFVFTDARRIMSLVGVSHEVDKRIEAIYAQNPVIAVHAQRIKLGKLVSPF